MDITRITVISFPDSQTLQPIQTGIQAGSMHLSEVLLSQGINFGEANANEFEATVFDIGDITGEKIYVYQLDENDNETPIFTGYVDSCKLDEFGYYRHIVAYDFLYSRGKVNIANWWGDFWDTQTESTLGEALRSLLDYMELEYVDAELTNDDMPITQTQDISSMKFIDMLKAMCELELVNPNINREGVLEFVDISDTTNTVDVRNGYEGGNSTFEDFLIKTISKVQIYDINGNIGGSYGEGTNCLFIQNNLFLYDKDAEYLQALAESVYTKVSTIQYRPATVKMIVSDFDIKVGTYVQTSKGYCLACELTYSNSLLIDQTITSRGNEILAEAKPYDPLSSNLQAQVNEVSDAVNGASTEYYKIQNSTALKVNAEGSRVIINRRYVTKQSGYVVFHAQVILDIDTVDDNDTFYEGIVRCEYTIGGEVVQSFQPTETLIDGRHTLTLSYVWDADANFTDSFIVTLYAEHCKVTIGAYRINGYLCGRGLVGDSQWDGTIIIEDEAENINIPTITVKRPDDNVVLTFKSPITIIASDTVGVLNLPETKVNSNVSDSTHFGDYLSELTWGDVAEYTWGAVMDNYSWGNPVE